MGKDEYLELPSQASCVQNTQNECRKAPFSSLLYHLRLMAYNPNHILLCFEFDLRKDRLTLDQGFAYCFLFKKWDNELGIDFG